jgi:hypothetical protein
MSHLHWNKMSSLGQFIHHYHDGIMFPCCPGKLSNKINGYYFPFSSLELEMVVANPLGVYAQLSLSDIPYISQCNQQHPSSFLAKSTSFLMLQLFSDNWDV